MPANTTPLKQEDELHWLALILVSGLGSKRALKLLERFRSPEAIFRASCSELEAAGLPGAVARSVASGCSFDDAANQHQLLRETGVTLIPIADPRYPPRLREILDPPPVLFARGQVELLQRVMIGIVGTRRPTPYGRAVAERLSADLAKAKLTVVSGMARGIDTSAHKGALSVEGDTVAVFGCGVDHVYPAENRKLAEELADKGLLLSEYPVGAPAHPQNFPVRNRIISGMSLGVVVVEGAEYSGSAITARLAMEQNREVFAVPGNVTSKPSWGPNLLIKQGAKLVQDFNDIIVELSPDERRRTTPDLQVNLFETKDKLGGGARTSDLAGASSTPIDLMNRQVLETLTVDTPLQLDAILGRLERSSPSEVVASLFDLEMSGAVRQLPGKNFVRVW